MAKDERSFWPGVILIALGTYFLLRRLDLIDIRWYETYPFILLILGGLFMTNAVVKKERGAVFPGTVLLVLGAFFFLRNFNLLPFGFYLFDLEDYWPVFLLAFGLGFVVLFFFKGEDWGLLIPGGLLLFFGAVILLRNLRVFYWRHFSDYWPVVLIVIGLAIVVNSLRRRPQ